MAGLDWSLWCSCPQSPHSELWHFSVCATGCSLGHLKLPLWNPFVWMTLTDSTAREAQLYKESLPFDRLAGSWLSKMSLSKALRLKTSLIHLHVGQTKAGAQMNELSYQNKTKHTFKGLFYIGCSKSHEETMTDDESISQYSLPYLSLNPESHWFLWKIFIQI